MKTFSILVIALFAACASHSQPGQPFPVPPVRGLPPAPSAPQKDPVNYLIHVDWKDAQGESKSLELLTAEGQIQFDGLQKNPVKINNNDVPVTLKLTGNLTVLNDEKGRLQMFLGRTVPYVTGTSGFSGGASYSQMSVGLQSTFIVNFGKPQVIQSDENGTISVLVKRVAD